MSSKHPDWPPSDVKGYIQGDRFGNALVDIATDFQQRYRRMDFSDAVAHVYAWFDGKIESDPDFINVKKFRSEQAFLAYIKQAAWNSARQAERQRRRINEVEAFPIDSSIADYRYNPEQLSPLFDMVDKLSYPHKMIFEAIFFEGRDSLEIASIYDRELKEVWEIYEEAIDMLIDMSSD